MINDVSQLNHCDAVERTVRYLEKLPPAISGQFGHGKMYRAACVVHERLRHLMMPEEALPVLQTFNARVSLRSQSMSVFTSSGRHGKERSSSVEEKVIVAIHRIGEGVCSFSGKSGDGVWCSFGNGSIRNQFLTHASFKRLLNFNYSSKEKKSVGNRNKWRRDCLSPCRWCIAYSTTASLSRTDSVQPFA